jgi:NAD/NADP transhydrogenase alpha subunit
MSPEFIAAEMALFGRQAKDVDIIITTALIPGKPAPILITEEMVASMRPGSVIVDLAAEQGGNVAGSDAGKDVVRNGVTIVGGQSVPSNVAFHASQAFSRNIEKLLLHVTADGAWKFDFEKDDIAKGCVITREGEIVQAKVKETIKS